MIRTGLAGRRAAHPPLTTRRRAELPRRSPACFLHLRSSLFTALLFVLFPRVGLSLLLMNHGHQQRQIGFLEPRRSRAGRRPPERSDAGAPDRDPRSAGPAPAAGHASSARHGARRVRRARLVSERGLQQAGTEADAEHHPRRALPGSDRRTASSTSSSTRSIRRSCSCRPRPPASASGRADSSASISRSPPSNIPKASFGIQPMDDRGPQVRRLRLAEGQRRRSSAWPAGDRPRYLALPPDLPERVKRSSPLEVWTKDVASLRTTRRRRSRRHLRSEYKYDLASPSQGRREAAARRLPHLRVGKRGHCEKFYSTAMAILLRSVGVPTRNVTGFVGGTYNRFGKSSTRCAKATRIRGSRSSWTTSAG